MRILTVSQYYWPEPFNVADICEELVSRGHEVTVLTGIPNYPEGNVYPGYAAKRGMEEERNGVRILRTPLRPRKTGAVNRFLNYGSFSRNASRKARGLSEKYDVVLAYEVSPVMSANPAIVYAKANDVPCVIYVLDIWPECLLMGGITKDSPIYKHYRRVSSRIYSSADVLVVSSPRFIDYLRPMVGGGAAYEYLPQYAEDIFAENSRGKVLQVSWLLDGYAPEGFDLTFAGNVGASQAVDVIVRSAKYIDGSVRIHIVGSGSELARCREIAKEDGLTNVFFHGRHPLEAMPVFYKASDALVVSFANSPVVGYTLPRKVQTYLAAGKPLVGAALGVARKVIEEADCGLVCNPGAPEAFAEVCRKFATSTDAKRAEWAANARNYYESNFERGTFFNNLERILGKVAKR